MNVDAAPAETISQAATARRWSRASSRFRQLAWAVMVLADVGLLAWAAMAFAAPDLLLGPGSTSILPAGFEGFTGRPWEALETFSPKASEYVTLLFRMYGLYGVAFSLLAIAVAATAFRRHERWAWWSLLVGNTITFVGAMTYDQVVRAVGPFELSEYLGLVAIYAALAVTAPFGSRSHATKAPRPGEVAAR